jgi:hypothetical protein
MRMDACVPGDSVPVTEQHHRLEGVGPDFLNYLRTQLDVVS